MRLNNLPSKWRKKVELTPGVLNRTAALKVAGELRFEAHLAYLDGRSEQARKYQRYADYLAREAKRND